MQSNAITLNPEGRQIVPVRSALPNHRYTSLSRRPISQTKLYRHRTLKLAEQVCPHVWCIVQPLDAPWHMSKSCLQADENDRLLQSIQGRMPSFNQALSQVTP